MKKRYGNEDVTDDFMLCTMLVYEQRNSQWVVLIVFRRFRAVLVADVNSACRNHVAYQFRVGEGHAQNLLKIQL